MLSSLMLRGPSQRPNRSGSVWARNTASAGASNSRTMSTKGRPAGAVMVVSWAVTGVPPRAVKPGILSALGWFRSGLKRLAQARLLHEGQDVTNDVRQLGLVVHEGHVEAIYPGLGEL